MRYQKPALSFSEQFNLLVNRGLIIPDSERLRALRWLKHVSYYRLTAYCLPFKIDDNFAPGTTFHSVAGLYIFDRKLRLILLDAVERIEVAMRTALTYEISHRYGPFGHIDSRNFAPSFDHRGFVRELREAERRSTEAFVSHFRRKYDEESELPIWMASELISFGWLSRLYKACHPEIKRKIAARAGVQDWQLSSWLHSLSYVRNVCAHHSRLWNRELAVRPALPRASRSWPYDVTSNLRLYSVLVIIRHLLKAIAPKCQWRDRLYTLFDGHQDIDLAAMQVPAHWRSTPPWV